jgi:hypothetical protein
MKKTRILAIAMVALLWHGAAAAETTTPIVPHDVGHWLNLEYRSGKLAPEIAGDRQLIRSILVVERSLAKIDAYLAETDQVSGCYQLLLPYFRIALEQVSDTDDDGRITLSNRKIRRQEKLPVQVCTTIENRVVFWESSGAMMILGRPRNDFGGFPRTLYALYQVTAEERVRWTERRDRFAARGKVAKPPRVKSLYEPPGDDAIVRVDDPMVSFFGAEFGLPPVTAGKGASEHPVSGQDPREPEWPER